VIKAIAPTPINIMFLFCFFDLDAQKPLFSLIGSIVSPLIGSTGPDPGDNKTGFVVLTEIPPTVVVVGLGNGEYKGLLKGLTGFDE
jgi:hypothetical protein